MSNVIIPARRSIELAENIADDVVSKVLDVPSLLYPAVVIAVFAAAWTQSWRDEEVWEQIHHAVCDYLELVFDANIEIDEDTDQVKWVSDNLPTIFDTVAEMEVIITHLAETIIDALAEYGLESNDDWFALINEQRRNRRGLTMRILGSRDIPEVNLRRKTIKVHYAPSIELR
jgi:hypothetical protein